ncbi:MAG: SixA phosphatase family protein, partial [Chloroflexota bacterium]
MKLYVMRHGPAEAQRDGLADADRALTAEGRAETVGVARGLARLGARPAVILSSPLVRARQTAEVIAQQLLDGEGVTLSELL